ncbi:dehydrogenase [uncultured Rothia sp.]|uniref:dehydrogenase n=1 Tax=uncultured Rothia sp. TaxID=316088 RepID=UPI003216271C
MGIKDMLQKRRDDAELGRGVWRRAYDRFNRGVDRFHQILEKLPRDETFEDIIPQANALADLLLRVRGIAQGAQTLAPSKGTDIPASPHGTYSDLHRSLSRAGNAVAMCAEALAMVRCAGDCELSCNRQIVVERRLCTVIEHIEHAEQKLAEAQGEAA